MASIRRGVGPTLGDTDKGFITSRNLCAYCYKGGCAYGKSKIRERSKVVPLHTALQGRRGSGLHCSPERGAGRRTLNNSRPRDSISDFTGGRHTHRLHSAKNGVGGAEY